MSDFEVHPIGTADKLKRLEQRNAELLAMLARRPQARRERKIA